MIRNVVFDMGGVLIRFDRRRFMQRQGVGPQDEAILMREVFQSVEWARLDRGSLTEEQAAERIAARVPERLRGAAEKLIFHWDRPIEPIEGMDALAGELKAGGYGVYLLSNASLRHPEYWPRVPASRWFDGVVVSAQEGLVKPQPEIYRLLCERFGLAAGECFFIDDKAANVEGACFAGMSGAVFHGDVAELRAKLREAGVNVGEG